MRAFLLKILVLICLLGLVHGVAVADDFTITDLNARLVNDAYVVDANIDYRFSTVAQEAMQNGVPLTLEMHLQLRRERAWVWEADLVDARLRYQIRHHALTGLYQVVNLQSKSKQNFATQGAALAALGTLSGIPLVSSDKLKKGDSYRLSLRTLLDIEALPLPLRPMAYLSSGWNLSSDRVTWYLKP